MDLVGQRAVEVAGDPRAGRYFQLLAVINGLPVQPGLMPVFEWFTAAMRHDLAAG